LAQKARGLVQDKPSTPSEKVGTTSSTLRAPFSARGSKDTGLIDFSRSSDIVNNSSIKEGLSKNSHSSSIKQEPSSSSPTSIKFGFLATAQKMVDENSKVYLSI
jgi:hypothetical protein